MDFRLVIFYNKLKFEWGIKMRCFERYDSPIGPLWLTGRDGILTGLSFGEPAGEYAPGCFDVVHSWLDDYFRGIPREIDFPMAPEGTPFQQLVWKLLLDIPYGKTQTYGALAALAARQMGKEKMSAQAIGQAVGRNPIAIIIPCHRCVGSDGKLTGYAYGIEKKQWFLNHEQNRQEEIR